MLVQALHKGHIGYQHEMRATGQGLRQRVVARLDHDHLDRGQQSMQARLKPADHHVVSLLQRSAA